MTEPLPLEALSHRTGVPLERLREWESLGLIGQIEAATIGDVETVRLVELFLRRGISMEKIKEAMQSGLLDGYRDVLFPEELGRSYSLAEAAEIIGLDLDMLQRFRDVLGGSRTESVSEDEIMLLRGWALAVRAGIPPEAIMQLIRVYADSLGRIAETEQSLFREYIQMPLKDQGLPWADLVKQGQAAAEQLNPLIEPVLTYFHRMGMMRAVREDIVMELAQRAGLVPRPDLPGQLHAAIMFIDLSSFTPLAESMGDEQAALVLGRFSEIVRRSAAAWGGRIVKQIGDAFMLVFSEPRAAVACAVEIDSQASEEPQFPAVRSGIHWGLALYREGDYVGSNVNIASRVANEATRHQVLVTAEVRKETAGLAGIEFVQLGKRRLKGLSDELELFEARSSFALPITKDVDPVCGMELGPAEVAASLTLEGRERAFCSEECLRRFVASPERYEGGEETT